MNNKKYLLFTIIIPIVLSGCGVLAIVGANSSEYDKEDAKAQKSGIRSEYSDLLVQKFSLMALFAELAYRRDLGEERSTPSACDGGRNDYERQFGMPGSQRYSAGMTTNDGYWRRWTVEQGSLIEPCVSIKGLFYETYVYENHRGVLEEAVIAFRGTENSLGQRFYDWSASLVSSIGFEPRQYVIARKKLPDLISSLKEENPDIKIYSVGHSLGGGLAQQLGFLSRYVSEVYTFNTSPVSNWTYLRLAKAVDNEYPVIYRVYHGGEFLEKIRFFGAIFTKTRYGRYDIGFQEDSRSNFTGHSMKIIACRLLHDAANGENAQFSHGFTRSLAIPIFLESDGVCAE